jgi:Rps23 Pro-64 3,4-dihydroxylase Tpa1-like proline 4-hydroxylase
MPTAPDDSRVFDVFNDRVFLNTPVEELKAAYSGAAPFPHIVIDNLFEDHLLERLLPEIRDMSRDKWLKVEQDSRERTMRMRSAAEIGPAGADLLGIVHSAAFLYLLSEITGIWQLLPDPYLQGAGYAVMRKGDYFHIHSDRNVAYETGLVRRLAMIIFLNKSWRPEYQGQLELWNSEATHCDVRIDPCFNKTVIFEVADPNFHGVPVPLACPEDRTRQSFILYFHTTSEAANIKIRPHTSIFAPRLHGTNRVTFRSFTRDLMPPILLRTIRKFTRPD